MKTLALTLFLPLAVAGATDLRDWQPPYKKWQQIADVALKADNAARFTLTEGQGAMANGPEGNTSNLFTRRQHGDAKVEIEFVVPKGSNSGVYLQGRYEIQVFDSHGNEKPEHSDCGGIYQRWDDQRQPQGYEGRPPLVNASKKPGEWQKFEIVFRAPRFDAAGKKIANAKFESVHLNGQLVQQDQEVTGPTRAAAHEDEQPLGALMVQGDHGPVAYRNLKIEPLVAREATSLLPDAAYEALAAYQFGQSRKVVSRVEETIRYADARQRIDIESKLLASLADARATADAKREILRLLRPIATEQAVEPLAKLLAQAEFSHPARLAMQGIASPTVDEALVAALAGAKGSLKTGLVETIGQRGSPTVFAALRAALADADEETGQAVFNALGNLGGIDAATVIYTAEVKPALLPYKANAALRCLEGLPKEVRGELYQKVHKYLAKSLPGSPQAEAALRGAILSLPAKDAVKEVLKSLASADAKQRAMASQLAAKIESEEATKMLAEKLSGLNAPAQAALVSALGQRRYAGSEVFQLVDNADDAVADAAIAAIGQAGGAGALAKLLAVVESPNAKRAQAAEQAIASMADFPADLPERLQAGLAKSQGSAKIAFIHLAGLLGGSRLEQPLIALANDERASVEARTAAWPALRRRGSAEAYVAGLAFAVAHPQDALAKTLDTELPKLGRTVAETRLEETNRALAQRLPELWIKADGPARARLLKLLSGFQGSAVLALAAGGLESADAAVMDAAVRTITQWNSPEALPLVTRLAKAAKEESHRRMAYRAYLNQLRDETATTAHFALAKELATEASRKRELVAALGRVRQDFALTMLEGLREDAEVKEEASRTYERLKNRLGSGK